MPDAVESRQSENPASAFYQAVVGGHQRHSSVVATPVVRATPPLETQWWGDRTFAVMDPYGYQIWFYQTVAEPKPPGTKIV